MSTDEIRKNKPNGATHYEIDGRFIYYFKFNNINLYIWSDKKYWMIKPVEWASDIKPLN